MSTKAVPAEADIDVLVIGAGVVGLAAAAEVARRGWSVVMVERHPGPGRETSSRNSEVIHAGMYYPPGSLRARLCVQGNRMLYEFCARHGVACRGLGKIIVATLPDELVTLEELLQRGQANGVPGLRLVDQAELRQLEPNVQAHAGLLSPSTGIIDTHGLMKTLEAQVHGGGGEIFYRCEARAIERQGSTYVVHVVNPSGDEQLSARMVVNAAGLESDRVARFAGIDAYQLHWCKGDYFAVAGRRAGLVSRLIYPVPSSTGVSLGIHVALDLAGRMRLGPDAAYVGDRVGADLLVVDPAKAAAFHSAARRYLPQLLLEDLQPDTAGIRPKLQGPGDHSYHDFIICHEAAAGFPGLINLVGIDSPGLTSALAIAQDVAALVGGYL